VIMLRHSLRIRCRRRATRTQPSCPCVLVMPDGTKRTFTRLVDALAMRATVTDRRKGALGE